MCRRYVTVLMLSTLFQEFSTAQNNAKPETVLVTYHAKPGSETELGRVIARHWATALELKLVRDAPHVLVRGTEDSGKTYFVEIFSWRDGSIPDAAPPAIQAIWAEMNKLVETRAGKPGLDFAEVSVLTP
jgi:hypothetical protein